jgi:hypothetical protein
MAVPALQVVEISLVSFLFRLLGWENIFPQTVAGAAGVSFFSVL